MSVAVGVVALRVAALAVLQALGILRTPCTCSARSWPPGCSSTKESMPRSPCQTAHRSSMRPEGPVVATRVARSAVAVATPLVAVMAWEAVQARGTRRMPCTCSARSWLRGCSSTRACKSRSLCRTAPLWCTVPALADTGSLGAELRRPMAPATAFAPSNSRARAITTAEPS